MSAITRDEIKACCMLLEQYFDIDLGELYWRLEKSPPTFVIAIDEKKIKELKK